MLIKANASNTSEPICFTVADLLGQAESAELIRWATYQGYSRTGRDYPDSYRNNDRLVCHREDLASLLFERLRGKLPERLETQGCTWSLVGLNPRFRGCRYRRGQKFERHRDGAYSPDPRRRSLLTVMLYLNDHREFSGGHTRYYHDRFCAEPYLSVPPEAGMGIIFDHALWHDGEAVTEGTKYVLRTDVIYEADRALEGHLGYIWDLCELDSGWLASGSRDQTVRIWDEQLQQRQILKGHTGSVTCLAFDGCHLWSGSRDHTLALWRRRGPYWSRIKSFPAHRGTLLRLLATPSGVYSAGADLRVSRWSFAGQPEESFSVPSWPWALQHAAEDIWCGCEDGELLLNGNHVWTSPSGILSMVATPSGLYLGCRDGTLRFFSPQSGAGAVWTGHRGPVTSLLRLDDRVVSGAEDDGVRLWEGGRSRELLRHRDFVRALVARSDGKIFSGGYDGRLRQVLT